MQDDFFKLALLVSKCFNHLNLSQKKNLADLVTAFLSNTSFAMWDRGKLFYKLMQQAVTTTPITNKLLTIK